MKPKQKNILFFTDTPEIGGAEHQMYLLAKFLDRSKFNLTLCCGPYESLNDWVQKFKSEKIPVIRLEIDHKNDTKQLKLLKDIIKEEKIDLIHANLWNPASGRFAFLAARTKKIPLIITEHDPFKLNFLKTIFKNKLIDYTTRIIAISKDNKKTISKLFPDSKKKIKVIHNGIDITWWKSQMLSFGEKDRTEIRTKTFKANPNDLVLLTAAELHPRKGLHIYLQAIQKLLETLPEKHKNLRFIIAGAGHQREVLEKLIQKRNLQDHVELIGRHSQIPQLMKSADIFVLPSIREAFGLVNLEAMLSGLPVIATRTGGIPEIVIDGKNGLLVPPENPEKLAEAIKKLITSRTLRKQLSKNNPSYVEKIFNTQKMAKAYEKIYKEI
ncbi:glycosyltransferase family 4 protein [Candidatus Peregrinibacteria bacterium]|jgi:glycosyltransferase involved in cell wall biosynthesis|nr:glycosyltransferase family 4 protein [Candidatus Peregrinibacteria bacterium]MBT4056302.1 glycosyltransferase family 4 protein [Candidatus Peregrinibacteria bacterium]